MSQQEPSPFLDASLVPEGCWGREQSQHRPGQHSAVRSSSHRSRTKTLERSTHPSPWLVPRLSSQILLQWLKTEGRGPHPRGSSLASFLRRPLPPGTVTKKGRHRDFFPAARGSSSVTWPRPIVRAVGTWSCSAVLPQHQQGQVVAITLHCPYQ